MKTCGLTEVQSTQASHQNASNNSVVNENMAQMGDYPWMTSIIFQNLSGRLQCGGAFIRDQWVLSTASCWQSFVSLVYLKIKTLI